MAKKIYRANFTRLTVNISVENKEKQITFAEGFKGGTVDTKASFSTDDKLLQEALEHSVFFNNLYFLETIEQDKLDEEAIPYTNKQDLYLKIQDRLPNADLSVSMTEKELLALATKNDLVFRKIK